MRYIRAGGFGIFGLLCLFIMFGITSTIILLSNWWLGRWSNSERIRYGFTNTTNNCSLNNTSKITTMSNEEWFKERDRYFYVLLGKYLYKLIATLLYRFEKKIFHFKDSR
jgi:hypothetical protein